MRAGKKRNHGAQYLRFAARPGGEPLGDVAQPAERRPLCGELRGALGGARAGAGVQAGKRTKKLADIVERQAGRHAWSGSW